MSRIGKQPIIIPKEVEISVNKDIKIKGPLGEDSMPKPIGFDFNIENDSLKVVPIGDILNTKEGAALWGLYRSLVSNMVVGVHKGHEKILEMNGVGFRAVVSGDDLEMQLGFSHPVIIKIPREIKIEVKKNQITISGYNKQLVGQIAANIRKKRPPEPYKGKGIKYSDEIIIRKAGKKAVATG